jgi:hypothetical protein
VNQDQFITAVEQIRKTLRRSKLRFTLDNRDPDEWLAGFKARQEGYGEGAHHYMDVSIGIQPLGFWGDCVYGHARFQTGRGIHFSLSWSSGGRDGKELPCCMDAADEHARAVKVLAMALRKARLALSGEAKP